METSVVESPVVPIPTEPPLREEMIQTAVKFLMNPNVLSTPLAQKQKFLQRKGLSDKEIQVACEKSGAYQLHEEQQRRQVVPALPPPTNFPYYPHNQLQYSFFQRVTEIMHNIAVFSVVGYIIHKFYKTFIEPFLFGTKRKSVEDSLDDVKTSVSELKDNLDVVKVEINRISHSSERTIDRQLSDLKNDVATVKGLLLGRKQFPSVANSRVVPPSIPDWQMSSVQSEPDGDSDRKEELLEVGSGSGSEPEHCTKTSESSLEIIYTTRDCDSESCNSRKSKEEKIDD